MKIAYFDCFSGISGDMFIGALLDAGCDAKALKLGLAKLPVRGYHIEIRKEKRGGFAGTRFEVLLPDQKKNSHQHDDRHSHDHSDHHHGHEHGHDHGHSHQHDHTHEHAHRTIREVETILKKTKLPESVKERARAAFWKIAEVEGKAHGIAPNKVHFHEVGALDSIVDVVGAAYALYLMEIDEIAASALPLGSGFVRCDHGLIPVPAPGTVGLLEGVPVRLGAGSKELVTPTGAALLTAWAKSIGEPVDLKPTAIGYGAGKRDNPEVANLLRVIIGEKAAGFESDQVYLLESNIDDMPGEMLGYALEKLLEAGAFDAYITPIQMKKSRPAVMLSAIVPPAKRLAIEEVFFRETTTLGLRRQLLERSKLPREIVTVKTSFGPVRCKVSTLPNGEKRISPEFDSLTQLAQKTKKSLPEISALVEKQVRKLLP